MKVYVIAAEYDDPECSPELIGVVSSRQTAIKACEKYLNLHASDHGTLKWGYEEDHEGWAQLGDLITSYTMFGIDELNFDL